MYDVKEEKFNLKMARSVKFRFNVPANEFEREVSRVMEKGVHFETPDGVHYRAETPTETVSYVWMPTYANDLRSKEILCGLCLEVAADIFAGMRFGANDDPDRLDEALKKLFAGLYYGALHSTVLK